MFGTRAAVEIIQAMSHDNIIIKACADRAALIILELDRSEKDGSLGRLGLQIRKKRFEEYNGAYLDAENNQSGEMDEFDDNDMSESGNDRDTSIDWKSLMLNRERLTMEIDEIEDGGRHGEYDYSGDTFQGKYDDPDLRYS